MKRLSIVKKNDLVNHLLTYASDSKKEKIKVNLALRTRFLTLVTEDIQKSHNASALLRTCDCMGIQDVHIVQDQDEYFSKYQTKGADKWLSVFNYKSITPCIEKLADSGYRIIALSPKAEKNIYELELNGPSAFLFGSEHDGLSKEALNLSDETVSVPMYGFTESLNVSVTAALVLSFFGEKLRNSTIDWQLTAEEQIDLRLEWFMKSIPNGADIANNLLKK